MEQSTLSKAEAVEKFNSFSSSSSSYIYHGVGQLVDPFQSHVSSFYGI